MARKRYHYDPLYPAKAKQLADDGLIPIEIASVLGVASGTLWTWEQKYPDLKDAMKTARETSRRRREERKVYLRLRSYNGAAALKGLGLPGEKKP